MKTTILKGVVLISALALASCSTTNQVASAKKADDDVYFSSAKAGDQPEYRQVLREDRYVNADEMAANDDDYYYYDSYASRINRFNYLSPFGYYDDYYYGYNSPYAYGGALGYGSPYGYGLGGGWGLGIGLGYGGWGFSPYGYGSYYGYSPFSYWGTGYGVGYGGGYPYWGVYSAYNTVGNYRARPNRQFGAGAYSAGSAVANRRMGYNGNYPNTGYYPGRATNSVRGVGSNNNGSGNTYYGGRQSRGVREGQPQPTYRPTSVERPTYTPSNNNSGRSSGGGGYSGGGGGGGGARPVRP